MAELRQRIKKAIDKALRIREEKLSEGLAYQGELFVKRAKLRGNYKDRSGNLRSSIGYIVTDEGNVDKEGIDGDKAEGVNTAKDFVGGRSREFPKGKVLIGFAAMEYARCVEHKNYDVISGSIPDQDAFKVFMEKIIS